MNIPVEVVLSAALSAAGVGAVAWIAVRVAVAKVTQRLDDKEKSDQEAAGLREQAQDTKAAALADTVASTAQALQASVTASADALAQAMALRHEEYCRRFDVIERKMGGANGGAFVDRAFCELVHRGTSVDVVGLKAEVHAASVKADEACDVARREAKGINDRLAKVEARLEALAKK